MAAYNKYQAFIEQVFEKVHNIGADTMRVILSNTAPNAATHSVKADATEIAGGNGYTSGGHTVTISSSAQSGGTYKAVGADVTITAAGGPIGPFRYAIFLNDTPTSPADPLVGYWDYGSSITLADGESFTVDLDPTNGVLQAA